MNELTIQQQPATKSTIGLAVKNNQTNQERLFKLVRQTILECCNIAGTNKPSEDITWMAEEMCKDIVRDFGNLTSDEVVYAFKSGAKDKYGTYYNGINIRNLNIFLREYSKSHERDKFVAKRERSIIEHHINSNRIRLPEAESISKENLDKMIANAEDAYRDAGYYNDYNNILYNALINHDETAKITDVDSEQAKSKYISDMKRKENACVHSVLDEIEQKGKDSNTIIDINAKKIAINRWLENRLFSE